MLATLSCSTSSFPFTLFPVDFKRNQKTTVRATGLQSETHKTPNPYAADTEEQSGFEAPPDLRQTLSLSVEWTFVDAVKKLPSSRSIAPGRPVTSPPRSMAPPQIEFAELQPGMKNYQTSGMVVEKGLPRLLGKTSTICQSIVFQNSKLNLSAKSPIEEIQIDGLTMRSLKYNFSHLADLTDVTETDVLFAILEVGPRHKPKNSWVADIQVIDQSLQPTTITLWDQFSPIEATTMANVPGSFPIAIGLHLRTSAFCGNTSRPPTILSS
ncbi:hypothetical protein Vadar_003781 [Vaccinium darrowii]|uniref:Uncharacterized protein n=1 Tax=Vaccinium darrowii TaxID=229202 RepID=A0ACB7YSU4_9ERIC|nr:hypothetical protein Vadar_003781 [Vaccinium darrowii]